MGPVPRAASPGIDGYDGDGASRPFASDVHVIVSQTIIKKFRRIENVTFRINHTRIKCNQT